jgi:hypothetical protein
MLDNARAILFANAERLVAAERIDDENFISPLN